MNAAMDRYNKCVWSALAIAAVLLVVTALLAGRQSVFLAYLLAWLFTLGICVGALVMRMVHVLTGGRWGEAIRPTLIALTAALPLVALLVVPLFFGLHHLFVWSRPEAVAASELLARKEAYLNVPFFVGRTVVALVAWSLLARAVVALDGPVDDIADPRTARLRRLSVGGLVVYLLSVTWFSTDWVMSLVPQWKSTGFGLVFALGQCLSGFAAALFVTAWSVRRGTDDTSPQTLNDLGNILLTLVLTWAYLAFMQYLIVWIGDQPGGLAWYLPRLQNGWMIVALTVVVVHFAAPFLVLLFRRAKRSAAVAMALGVGLLLAHWLDLLWLIAPAHTAGFVFPWADAALTIAVLAILRAWLYRHRHGGPTPSRHGARKEAAS